MKTDARLDRLLTLSASRDPDRTAVEDPERGLEITYRDLDRSADAVRDALVGQGVRPGDRVALCAPKSIAGVASLFGILRAGAGYVPVDPTAPLPRSAGILADCQVRAAIVDAELRPGLSEAIGNDGLPEREHLEALRDLGPELVLTGGCAEPATFEDVAYVLYTSGSTGKPKGVVHTHASALSFVDWCSDTFVPTSDDRFSSHAPFHFDLSILDLYVPIKHGATLVLFGELMGRAPQRLGQVISERRISVWYSTPSILRLILEFGDLDSLDWKALRIVLFAGEVFPSRHLATLRQTWPAPRFFNLYGPTETNVCTFFEVPDRLDPERTEPYPIGRVCANDRGRVVDEAGEDVEPGEEGELVVEGGTVMVGYWNDPDRTNEVFLDGADGARWYRTGDIVRQDADGDLEFRGRRDRMVKRSGYRVELGEIEAALYGHPAISEAAVVAIPDSERGVIIRAFASAPKEPAPSLIEMKRFCAERLPGYMIPDAFIFRDALPKTSTDKIDYQRLSAD